ncbi:Inner membrane transport permease YbhS [Chlamydiales bacterium STE3]|nr:Inner membrane transport permease YbhS [Chlamydiales bacterium STE3]
MKRLSFNLLKTMAQKTIQDKSNRLRKLKALMIKEFYQIVRDPSSILISFVLPLILMFLYGFGVSLDMNHLKIGLVLEDTSPDALSFAKAIMDSRFFDVKIARHRQEFDEAITKGAIRGLVVVPQYFSAFRKRPPNMAPIQVIADGSEPNTASFVQNYVQGAWAAWLEQERISNNLKGLPLVSLQPRFWYNEQLESRNFLIPGSLAIIMTLIGTLLTALVVAREWERGTMEALMSTPISIADLLLGKLIPYFVLGMISMTMCVIWAVVIYQVPLRGSWLLLAFVSGVFLFSALGLGLLISTIARNQFVAAQAAMVAAFLPGFILSGFIFEILSMPLPIQWITYIIPARYFVSSLQTLFLVGNVWSLILYNIVPMFVVGMLFFMITVKKTVKRLD